MALIAFVKKCNLDKHVKVCHGDEDDLGDTCEICLNTFEYRIELERHRKLYTGIDGSFKFVCGYCEKSFVAMTFSKITFSLNQRFVIGARRGRQWFTKTSTLVKSVANNFH